MRFSGLEGWVFCPGKCHAVPNGHGSQDEIVIYALAGRCRLKIEYMLQGLLIENTDGLGGRFDTRETALMVWCSRVTVTPKDPWEIRSCLM